MTDQPTPAGSAIPSGRRYSLSQQTCDDIMRLLSYICAAEHVKPSIVPDDELMLLVFSIRSDMKQAWDATIDEEIA